MEWFYLIFTILQMKESEYLLVGSYLLIFHIIHVGMTHIPVTHGDACY